jgi:hypothetical protein
MLSASSKMEERMRESGRWMSHGAGVETHAQHLLALWRARGELAAQRWRIGVHTTREAVDVLASAGQLARRRIGGAPSLEEQLQQTQQHLQELIHQGGSSLGEVAMPALQLEGWMQRAQRTSSSIIWASGWGRAERDQACALFESLEEAVLARGELEASGVAVDATPQEAAILWALSHPERFLPVHELIRATLHLIDPSHSGQATQSLSPLYDAIEEQWAGGVLLEQLARGRW